MASVQRSAYPIDRPAPGGSDPRFTVGLAIDVAAVLERHGFPAMATAADLVRVQQALFELIYRSPQEGGR